MSPDRKQSFTKSNRKSSSPSTNNSMMDFKSRKGSSESNMSFASRGAIPPPPPPPMPPPLDPSDEARGFLDPYGRAKTVRIGKWRWPPPKGNYTYLQLRLQMLTAFLDESNVENGEDFMQFKMRQHQRKVTPNKAEQAVMTNGHSNKNGGMQHSAAEWEEIEFEPVMRETERTSKSNSRRSFEVGVNRPSPGSVGKLKLSSEMRQRLEQV